mmetsp:Transcript_1904/g.11628  ORF Transcript_1904/g.11628 Transcript_1904/m.11628 type:complete len:145 (-) Transcript_1904:2948-3382(-)
MSRRTAICAALCWTDFDVRRLHRFGPSLSHARETVRRFPSMPSLVSRLLSTRIYPTRQLHPGSDVSTHRGLPFATLDVPSGGAFRQVHLQRGGRVRMFYRIKSRTQGERTQEGPSHAFHGETRTSATAKTRAGCVTIADIEAIG